MMLWNCGNLFPLLFYHEKTFPDKLFKGNVQWITALYEKEHPNYLCIREKEQTAEDNITALKMNLQDRNCEIEELNKQITKIDFKRVFLCSGCFVCI